MIDIKNEANISQDEINKIVDRVKGEWPKYDSIMVWTRFKEGKVAITTFASMKKS